MSRPALSACRTSSDLVRAVCDMTGELSPDEIKAAMQNRESREFVLSRMIARYYAALDAAPRLGLVGVGAITFAESRLATFIRRAGNAGPSDQVWTRRQLSPAPQRC